MSTPKTICKTCGVPKKYHSTDLWNAHSKMHESYVKEIKLLKQIGKKYGK